MPSIDHSQALKRVFPCCQGNVVDAAPGPVLTIRMPVVPEITATREPVLAHG